MDGERGRQRKTQMSKRKEERMRKYQSNVEKLRRARKKRKTEKDENICVRGKKTQPHTDQEMEGEKKNAADMMTYSGFLWSPPPRSSLKHVWSVCICDVCQWEVEQRLVKQTERQIWRVRRWDIAREKGEGNALLEVDWMWAKETAYQCSPLHCGGLSRHWQAQKQAIKWANSDLSHFISAAKKC